MSARTAHVYVYKIGGVPFGDLDDELQADDGARASSARRRRSSGQGPDRVVPRRDSTPVEIKGIDPALEPQVTDIAGGDAVGQSLDGAGQPVPDAPDGVILGAELARRLRASSVGDIVTVVDADSSSMGLAARAPTQPRRSRSSASRSSASTRSTRRTCSSRSRPRRRLLGAEGPDLHPAASSRDIDDARRVCATTLQEKLGSDYQVDDWTELNAPLYSALWLEKVAISLTIGLIVMVAALNIVASLVLLVMEKSRDIAILRTMGAPARAIRRIFVLQGADDRPGRHADRRGARARRLLRRGSLRADQARRPTSIRSRTCRSASSRSTSLIVVVSAIGVCLLATIYPSRQAARLDPAEALRNQ